MRFDGKLKSWNDERGFGFIEPTKGGQEVFVHIKSFPPGTGRPVVGLTLSFEVELGPNGKKRAKGVEFIRIGTRREFKRVEAPANWTPMRILVIPLFALVFAFVAVKWSVRPAVVVAYVLVSVVAFFAYAMDKSAAKAGRWRISESTLHVFSLAGGWPGALLAQQFLRHKSSKQSFLTIYWATVLLNIGGFVAYHLPLMARFRT